MVLCLTDINVQIICELIDCLKACIMSRTFVLSPRIAETSDNFHVKHALNHKLQIISNHQIPISKVLGA
jgi:hypothetical protein